ncbi:DNA/RNA non-specific endonuclease [Sinorhizobium meliloti]|nr:DNA/RNA non-specific endonuclease [Sinorhizobium meliloti]
MKSYFFAVVLASAVLLAGGASAEVLPTGCSAEYVGGTAPDVVNPKLGAKLRELCYSQFAVYHSGITATPLFVAQRLSAELIARAKGVERVDEFHAETRLPRSERAELSHYRSSGYDRGHMAPAADMATKRAQDESFSLANMIPQKPSLNRREWADIEATTRKLASGYGEVYVVSGPVFAGASLSKIGGRVLVPTAVYKAVYVPSTGQSSAWWADNVTGGMEVVSIAELGSRIGADVFPAVPASSKAALVSLPLPADARGIDSVAVTGAIQGGSDNSVDRRGGSSAEAGWWEHALAILVAVLEAVVRMILKE